CRLGVPWLDRGDVVAVAEKIVRIDIARDLDERLQRFRRQRLGIIGPGILDADACACRGRNDRHRGGGTFKKDAAIISTATIDFSHGFPPTVSCKGFPLVWLTEAATPLDHLDLVAIGVGDEEEAGKRRALVLEVTKRPGGKVFALEPGVLGINVV